MRTIDLDNPVDARFFLRGVRIEGNAIKWVTLADGSQLEIDLMTDDQAIRYAKEIYTSFLGGVDGGRMYLDEGGQLQ